MAFTRTNVIFDRDTHTVFLDEVGGAGHVSEAFRIIEEEFVKFSSDNPDLSIPARARAIREQARHKVLSQKKLLKDEESMRIDRERQEADRKAIIERETRAAVRKLGFKREYLRDRDHMCYQTKRDALSDEVSLAVRLDLQFKDLYPIVAAAVLEGEGA